MNIYEFSFLILQCIIGTASIVIAIYVFKLNHLRREDSWVKSFNELHNQFWNDDSFKKVRSWIANDNDYQNLEAILIKRLIGRQNVTKIEYEVLDNLDKFFNFMIKCREMGSELQIHKDLWEKLYFQYWIEDIIKADRYFLWKYYKMYYLRNKVDLLSNDKALHISLVKFEKAMDSLYKDLIEKNTPHNIPEKHNKIGN